MSSWQEASGSRKWVYHLVIVCPLLPIMPWWGWRDSNPHGRETTKVTAQCVYQFRHIPVSSCLGLTTPALVSLCQKVHTRAGFVFLPSASVSKNAGASFLLIDHLLPPIPAW